MEIDFIAEKSEWVEEIQTTVYFVMINVLRLVIIDNYNFF